MSLHRYLGVVRGLLIVAGLFLFVFAIAAIVGSVVALCLAAAGVLVRTVRAR